LSSHHEAPWLCHAPAKPVPKTEEFFHLIRS
jgi:hypothetical protein